MYKSPHCTNSLLDYDEEGTDCGGVDCPPCTYANPHCNNSVLDFDEDKTDCGGKDCPLCEFEKRANHCYNGVRDGGEIFIDQGGPNCLPIFCFVSGIPGDKTNVAGNCGGSCAPCVNRSLARAGMPDPRDEYSMAVCDSPPSELLTTDRQTDRQTDGRSDGHVFPGSRKDTNVNDAYKSTQSDKKVRHQPSDISFEKVDLGTGFELPGCLDGTATSRGFEFGEVHHAWSTHWAGIDSVSPNDVVVMSIEVDASNGDVYVLATANKTTAVASSNGSMAVMAKHFDKDGLVLPSIGPRKSGYWSAGSRDEFVVENSGRPVIFGSLQYIYTLLARVDSRGMVKWITMIDSLGAVQGRSLLIDATVTPTAVYVAGNFRGSPPRFYVPNLTTRKPRRGPEFKDGESCCGTSGRTPTNLTSTPPEMCWFVCGEGVRTNSPIDSDSPFQSGKWGVFIAVYDTFGVVRGIQTGGFVFEFLTGFFSFQKGVARCSK